MVHDALQALILAVNLPVQLSVPMMIGYLLCGMGGVLLDICGV